jgi:hypothetical protein
MSGVVQAASISLERRSARCRKPKPVPDQVCRGHPGFVRGHGREIAGCQLLFTGGVPAAWKQQRHGILRASFMPLNTSPSARQRTLPDRPMAQIQAKAACAWPWWQRPQSALEAAHRIARFIRSGRPT